MHLNKIIHHEFIQYENDIDAIVENFNSQGEVFINQDRNLLKLFNLKGKTVNVKSFKVPNSINQLVYKFIRKSKAQRSFDYANILLKKGIGTPQPIAFYEYKTLLLFKKSYYVSEQQDCEITYRELTTNLDYPDHENILRAFTRFTFKLHENNVHFLDHSPGNTLIKKENNSYSFYLVDLNRIKFGDLDFETRVKNFSKLTIHKSMVEIMSNEYAKCLNKGEAEVFNLMWKYTKAFQEKYYRKIRMKRRVFFWKKKYKNLISESPIK